MDQKSPSPRTKKNKKRALRAAFVVTASIGAGGIAGCDSEITNPPFTECPTQAPSSGASCDEAGLECVYDGECELERTATCGDDLTWSVQTGGTCNPPPPPECPETAPGEGDSCGEAIQCTYEFNECGDELIANCENGVWNVHNTEIESCNPPVPCPEAAPEEGSPCDAWSDFCSYELETACGPALVQVTCEFDDETSHWTYDAPPCTPKTPDCSSYTSSSLCSADTSCRWLVPGCGEGPAVMFAEGCYPSADCTADTCDGDTTCTPIVYNPCWNAPCDACGGDAAICVAPPDGV
ncbi:MAG: hypothetical protein HOW73_21895 [Polyangiaceae bacterium]|nr:hypothetical protein [Polyangiaceae bacterium]